MTLRNAVSFYKYSSFMAFSSGGKRGYLPFVPTSNVNCAPELN